MPALDCVLHSSGSLLTGAQVAPPMCACFAGVRVQARFCRPHLGPPGLPLLLGFSAMEVAYRGGTESSPCLPLTRRMWAGSLVFGSCCFLRVAPCLFFHFRLRALLGRLRSGTPERRGNGTKKREPATTRLPPIPPTLSFFFFFFPPLFTPLSILSLFSLSPRKPLACRSPEYFAYVFRERRAHVFKRGPSYVFKHYEARPRIHLVSITRPAEWWCTRVAGPSAPAYAARNAESAQGRGRPARLLLIGGQGPAASCDTSWHGC